MSKTHVEWKCYGTVDTDDPAQVEEWKQLQLALVATTATFAHSMWTANGQGTLWIMDGGVSEP